MLASYEKNFPLKILEPVFRTLEDARKEAEKEREAAKKAKKAAEKAKGKPVGKEEKAEEPGARLFTCKALRRSTAFTARVAAQD